MSAFDMHMAARDVIEAVEGLTAVLDRLNAAGLVIPPPAVTAVETLAALGLALGTNANGQPVTDPAARRLLGLPPIPAPPDPDQLTIPDTDQETDA